MKKKFLAMYALAGALVASPVFTSCVDDTESASVTAIRNAKAEQLKAAAELSKAQAEAATIQANADAALKAAEAAYRQALADAENQSTKEAAEKYARELETIQLQAELAYLQAQQAILAYQQQLASDEITRFSTLMNSYTYALSNLTDLNTQLTTKKAALAALEAGVITLEAVNKKTVYEKELLIKQKEAIIALLKDPTYAALDKKELAAKLAVAQKEFDLAQKTFNASEPTIAALIEAGAAYKEKNEAMSALIQNVMNLTSYCSIELGGGASSNGRTYTYYTKATYNGAESETADGWSTNGYITIKEVDILTAKKNVADEVESKAKILGKETDAKDTETEEGSGTLTAYAKLAAANAQMAEAEALTDAAAKATAVATAERAIADAKDALTTALKEYNAAVEKQTKCNELLAAVGNQEAIDKIYEELEVAEKAQTDALDAFEEACANGSVKEKEIAVNAIQALINNTSEDIEYSIISLEKDIADAKAAIEETKTNNNAQAIASKKAEIADFEYKIELQEKLVAEYKALLDAYLAEDETEEEA